MKNTFFMTHCRFVFFAIQACKPVFFFFFNSFIPLLTTALEKNILFFKKEKNCLFSDNTFGWIVQAAGVLVQCRLVWVLFFFSFFLAVSDETAVDLLGKDGFCSAF